MYTTGTTGRRPWRGQRALRLLAAGLLVLASCTDGDSPVDLDFRRAPALAIRPQFSVLGGQSGTPLSINRIRLMARDSSSGAILGQRVLDGVDPGAASWTLELDIRVPEGVSNVVVVVGIELIHVTGDVEEVQWSGLSPAIRVTPGSTQTPDVPITLYQGPPENLAVTAVTIEAPTSQVTEGDVVELTARATTPTPASPQIFWSSLDPAVAVAGPGGRVTTLRDGTARIVAEAGPRADTVALTVLQRPHAVRVTPERAHVTSLGAEVEFEAAVLDPRGAAIAGTAVVWQTEPSAVAEHLGGGRVRARSVGSYALAAAVASDPGVRATAVLEVTQQVAGIEVVPEALNLRGLNGSAQLLADPRDANGNPVAEAMVHWSSDNPAVAVVSVDGMVRPTGVGTAVITAAVGHMTASASVEVRHEPARVNLAAPAAPLHAIGATMQATATVAAADGTVLALPVVWASSDEAVATVDPSGLVTARGNGTATISAVHESLRGETSVTVRQIARTISVDPAALTLVHGQSAAITVTAVDANGHPVGGTVTWTSSAEGVASVSAGGTVTAGGPGSAVVTATRDSVSAEVAVTVQAPNLTASSLTLGPAVASVGESLWFELTVRNTGDASAPATRAAVILRNADNGDGLEQASVSVPELAAGASATAAGSFALTAGAPWPDLVAAYADVDPYGDVLEADRTDNQVASTTVEIRPELVLLVPTPTAVSLHSIGGSAAVSAAAQDRLGRPLVRPLTWQSADPSVATVSAEGLVTAVGNGSTVVEVRHGAVHATVAVTVEQRPHVVAPEDGEASVILGGTLPLQVRDAGGTIIPASGVTWSVAPSEAGSIDDAGVFHAATAGAVVVTAARGGATASLPVQVTAPNLGFAALTLPQEVMAGAAVAGTLTLANTGDAAAAASALALSVRAAGTDVVVHELTLAVPAIAAGAELVVPVSITLPVSEALPAAVDIELVLDPAHAVPDADRSDNRVLHGPVTISFPVHAIEVAPNDVLLPHIGATADLTVVLRDQFGRPLAGRAPSFTSLGDAIAVVSGSGTITGVGHGRTQLEVSADGVVATVDVTVQGTAAEIVMVRGNGQIGRVGEVLPQNLLIEVRDAGGNPLAGVEVEWLIGDVAAAAETSAMASAAAVDDPPIAGALSEALTVTDAAGRAEVSWQLGRRAGLHRATARAVSSDVAVVFHATARPGPPARGRQNSGGLTATVSLDLTDAIEIQIFDEFDNPVPEVEVLWQVQGGGPHSVLPNGQQSATTTTDDAGITSLQWSGFSTTVGLHRLRVSVDGTPVELLIEKQTRAASPARGQKNSGGLTATVSLGLSDLIEVQLFDEFDNPVPDVEVLWQVQGGGPHSVLPNGQQSAVTTTNAQGVTQLEWGLSTQAGLHRLRASVDGTPVNLLIEKQTRPGALKKLNLVAERETLTALEEELLFTVSPTDEFDNPIDGVEVTWESSDPTILEAAPVHPGQGRGRSKQNGEATITARGSANDDEVTETTVITVAQEATVAGLTITGGTEVVAAGVLLLTASGVDANNRPITQFRWSVHAVDGDDQGSAEILGGNQGTRQPTIELRGLTVGQVKVRVTDPAGKEVGEVIVRVLSVQQ